APLLLVAGAAAAAFILVPHLPEQRHLELRIDDVSSVVAVELSVARDRDDEPIHGNTWHFAPGQAPDSLGLSMNLPEGRYEVDITVERTQGRQSTHRVISVGDSHQITLPVR